VIFALPADGGNASDLLTDPPGRRSPSARGQLIDVERRLVRREGCPLSGSLDAALQARHQRGSAVIDQQLLRWPAAERAALVARAGSALAGLKTAGGALAAGLLLGAVADGQDRERWAVAE
jgi:hypothetical protein